MWANESSLSPFFSEFPKLKSPILKQFFRSSLANFRRKDLKQSLFSHIVPSVLWNKGKLLCYAQVISSANSPSRNWIQGTIAFIEKAFFGSHSWKKILGATFKNKTRKILLKIFIIDKPQIWANMGNLKKTFKVMRTGFISSSRIRTIFD